MTVLDIVYSSCCCTINFIAFQNRYTKISIVYIRKFEEDKLALTKYRFNFITCIK